VKKLVGKVIGCTYHPWLCALATASQQPEAALLLEQRVVGPHDAAVALAIDVTPADTKVRALHCALTPKNIPSTSLPRHLKHSQSANTLTKGVLGGQSQFGRCSVYLKE
jgi:hypothetical protein